MLLAAGIGPGERPVAPADSDRTHSALGRLAGTGDARAHRLEPIVQRRHQRRRTFGPDAKALVGRRPRMSASIR